MKLFNKKLPSQEQVIFGLLLTFVGGFFDSYTYINSNGIFANAQTGNLIFFGLELAHGRIANALNYIPSVSAFVIGVIFNEHIINKYDDIPFRRYVNLSLLLQTVMLIVVYFVPFFYNIDLRPLAISFVCAMQFDSFRTVNNIPFASIFCTGNLRSASEHIYKYTILKEKASLNKFYIYSLLIIVFLAGVVMGGILSNIWKHHALLLVIFVMSLNLVVAIFHDVNRQHS